MIGPIRRWRLHGRASRRTWRAAFHMLPPEVQEAVAAALGQEGDARQAFKPAATPPYLFAVRYDRAEVFEALRHLAWARPDLLGVAFDRRWMGERRNRHRPGHLEKRRGERRCSVPERTWTTLGFLLVKPTEPAPLRRPPPAVSVRPSSPADPTTAVDGAESVERIPVARTTTVWPRSGRRVLVGALWTFLLLGAVSVLELYIRPSGRPITVTGPAPSPDATIVQPPVSAVTGDSPAPERTAPGPSVAPPGPSHQERGPVAVKAATPAESMADNEATRAAVALERSAVPRPPLAATPESTPARLLPNPQVLPAPPPTRPAVATNEPDPSDIIDWLLKERPRSSD